VAEPVIVLFRDRTADGAVAQPKAWARSEGLTLRTIGSVRRRDDMPAWGDDTDPNIPVYAWDVTLVVRDQPEGLELPTLPEAPTLPLWEGVA
jgi:hypothetical protein